MKIHWPYVLAEAFFVAYQLAWAVLFAASGLVLCAVGAAYMAACVLFLAFFYGDHAGQGLFFSDIRGTLARMRAFSSGSHRPAIAESDA